MPDYVCMKCGHRQMDRDSKPHKEATNEELLLACVFLACWGRLQEMEKIEAGLTTVFVSPEAMADYGRLKQWWNDIGSTNRNNVKRAAAQYSMMLEETYNG